MMLSNLCTLLSALGPTFRLPVKLRVCYAHTKVYKRYFSLSSYVCKSADRRIEIGGVVKDIKEAKHEYLVPSKYDGHNVDQLTLRRLRWMMQKDSLGQDIFLIGPPGPEKLRLALLFSQLMNHEVEYIALSRDTTESDLKQRREIRNGTAFFEDQAAVRAAVHGRMLVLDGIEKTERNVLPVLNNLLENREMPLEDGRSLISSNRYDKLLKESSQEDMERWKLVRVDEKFRVIALGLPIPKYAGHPLDPPLRSRFQALDIGPKTFKDQLHLMQTSATSVREDLTLQLASFAYAVNAPESKAQGLPDFPIDNLPVAAKLMEKNKDLQVDAALCQLYPYRTFLTSDGQKMIEDLLDNLSISRNDKESNSLESSSSKPVIVDGYVANEYHDSVVKDLMDSISVHDICLIGPRGSGKSILVKQLAKRLSLDIEPIMLYQDMTARELLQQRSTMENGDTVWRPSPLLSAAIHGKIAVMDGLHRLNSGTLFTIRSLIHEREAQLFDGSRVMRRDRYDDIKRRFQWSEKDMTMLKLYPIHPDFRIVALAEPPNCSGESSGHWLTPEIMSMFLFQSLRPLKVEEEIIILEKLIGGALPPAMRQVMQLSQLLRNSNDATLSALSSSLSTRQLLRIAKRLKEYPSSDASDLVQKASLSKFLPRLAQEALGRAMQRSGLEIRGVQSLQVGLKCLVDNEILTIGKTSTPLYAKGNQAKVPDVLFFDNDQHIGVLESLLQDLLLGEHLLLIGNQGVGKNRIIDRLLALMKRPREYIQLHRDTTVQSLTVQPTVHNGIVTFQDSPLVRAAREGSILLVDEADKAPTQVTCILKTLVENGEMLLSDGRRILPDGAHSRLNDDSGIIRLHPDFRIIVLANRPGFPFLGNDFFASLGDLFGVHAVENPSLESELQLLRNYGPNVPVETIRKLVEAFSQLRSLADQGQLTYPYSTREVINIVKHLERYPGDGIVRVISNVFDFDAYSGDIKDTITRVFHQHGIPLGASVNNVQLARQVPMEKAIDAGKWTIMKPEMVRSTSKILTSPGLFSVRVDKSALAPSQTRLLWFTEQKFQWMLPLGDSQNVHASTVSENGIIHVLATNPSMLFSIDVKSNGLSQTHLDGHLQYYGAPDNRLSIFSLKNRLLIYDSEASRLLLVDVDNRKVEPISMKSPSNTLERLSQRWIASSEKQESLILAAILPQSGDAVFYQCGGNQVQVFNVDGRQFKTIQLDFDVQSVFPVAGDRIVINQQGCNKKYLLDVSKDQMSSIEESQSLGRVTSSVVQKGDFSVMFAVEGYFGAIMTAPKNTIKVWPGLEGQDEGLKCLLPDNSMIVRGLGPQDVTSLAKQDNCSGYLQVADLSALKLRYIPVPKLEERRRYGRLLSSSPPWHQVVYDTNHIITVDNHATVRMWEVNASTVAQSLDSWRKSIGDDGGIQLTIQRLQSGDVSSPKVGKIDPNNDPHVGGNQWAGGTGGRDTAGLGGKGGPYRLDAGHAVHQVSDEEKAAVPEHVKRAAREMGQKAYQERLEQIRMSPFNAELYQQFSSSVQKQVQSLRVILSSLQAKSKERQWLKHQTYGDLDDTKLIEGLTGEKNIYRRRAENEPELGTPLQKPKHLRLLVDVSGSMYRFNGYDRRLEREMAATLLFMEALEGHSTKWRYDVIGHSGETLNLELVHSSRPPRNEKERFDVLLNMHAHAQFCMSGDHTLEATRQSISALSQATDIDEAFLILLSDANLDRYGIPASHLARCLTDTKNVRCATVFIGSLGNQAAVLSEQMPTGSAYVCMDLEKLPNILQQIFTSVLLTF